MTLGDLSYIFELVAFLLGLYFIPVKIKSPISYIKWLMGLVVLVEISAGFLRFSGINNSLIYNIFILSWFAIYIWYFRSLSESLLIRSLFLGMLTIYIIFGIFDFYFYGFTKWLAHRTYIFGSMIVGIAAVTRMSEIIRKPYYLNILDESEFWIAFAVLVYFFPNSILLGFNEYLRGSYSQFSVVYFENYIKVNAILNGIHYSLISYAFYCHNRQLKEKNARLSANG